MTIDLQKDISDLQGSTTGIREEMDGRFTAIGDQLNKQKAEAVKIANRSRYGSEQASEFAPFDESGNIRQDSNPANSSSFGPVEDVSEDF